ncbi:MAG: pyridoxamine 5'-phosphate oxidase [Methylomonas sp.]|nr:MAG: pyridoxamine 5'-phosphate oxidase [Methylomonas sp.]
MSDLYGPQHRALQEDFDSIALADRVDALIVTPDVAPEQQGFIESRDFFFLTSIDHRGYPTCSYKGGDIGLVKVVDSQTLAFPIYDGNGMFLSTGNIVGNAKVGLLFIDFETPHRVRVHGDACLDRSDELMAAYPEAKLIIRVNITEIFINCPRYIHRYQRIASSKYVPKSGQTTPDPQWKRIDLLQDSLSAQDQLIADRNGGLITIEEYGEMVIKGEG